MPWFCVFLANPYNSGTVCAIRSRPRQPRKYSSSTNCPCLDLPLSTLTRRFRIDPRFTQESPEILALSAWLEGSKGSLVACSALSIIPGVGTILAAINYTVTGARIMAAGVVVLCAVTAGVFWVCGRSLIRAIDHSLHQRKATSVVGEAVVQRGGGDETLLASRKKAKRMVVFIIQQSVMIGLLLLFSIFSKLGAEAPVLFFATPLGCMPLLWQMVLVQVFAGRSKLRASKDLFSGVATRSKHVYGLSGTNSSRQGERSKACPPRTLRILVVPSENIPSPIARDM